MKNPKAKPPISELAKSEIEELKKQLKLVEEAKNHDAEKMKTNIEKLREVNSELTKTKQELVLSENSRNILESDNRRIRKINDNYLTDLISQTTAANKHLKQNKLLKVCLLISTILGVLGWIF